jgi:hypothetical protein
MGPAVDSRIKTPDAGIPLLQSESEVRAAEHSSSADQLSNVMLISPFSVLEINELQTLSSFHVLPQHTFENISRFPSSNMFRIWKCGL